MLYLSVARAQVRNFASKFIKNERGVTAIEYAVVAAGVSAILLLIFKNAQGGPVYDMLNGVFSSLKTKLANVLN